jgi:PPK2 family polyphosphate:nucleotide phosphotransferase
MHFSEKLMVKPGKKFRLSDWDPGRTHGVKDKETALELLEKNKQWLCEFQNLLYAGKKRAVLIVLQGMDTSGKDGTIWHVFSGVNPQGCRVTPFKVPSAEEAAHDYLWRVHAAVPAKGQIGIFNRSHYEDVLIVRVHGLVPKAVWVKRYDQIRAFEKILAENNVTILKFFLYISKNEQGRRLREREEDPKKHWKENPVDWKERKLWNDYMRAYADAVGRTSAPGAPWYMIPSDKKWFRHFAVSQILAETLA